MAIRWPPAPTRELELPDPQAWRLMSPLPFSHRPFACMAAAIALLHITPPHQTSVEGALTRSLDPTCKCASIPADDGYYEDGVWLTLSDYAQSIGINIRIELIPTDGNCDTTCEPQAGCTATLKFRAVGPFGTTDHKLCLPFQADENAYKCANEQDATTGLWQCCVTRDGEFEFNPWEWSRAVEVGCGSGGSWNEIISAPPAPGIPAAQPLIAECRWGMECASCTPVQPPG